MRIGDIHKNKDMRAKGGKRVASASTEKRVEFMKTLDSHQERERLTNLGKLLERVDDMGKILARSRNLSDVKRFKNAIMDFMAEANSRTWQLREENSWDHLGNRRHQILVEKIDEKMEELTQEIKNNQEDNLRILELIDEIRGLLVDEYM